MTARFWRYSLAAQTPREEWHARSLRVARALRGNAAPGARVLVVAHGGFNIFLLSALLGLPGPQFLFRFMQYNTGLTRIVFQDEEAPAWDRVQLHCMNDLRHLKPEQITD